jgi:aryl sulfotransferase
MSAVTWPTKRREFHNHHFDSTVWNHFQFREDDIIIASYAKSGTTWMQQIAAQLLFEDADDLPVADISPWLDLRVQPNDAKLGALEAQTHRRFIKTHLPVEALVYSPKAKYIYIARDGRDVVWSMYNHHANANDLWYAALNDTPGRVGPPIGKPPESIRQYFLDWLDGDGYPLWPFWENVSSWWAIRNLPNLMLLHFEDLRRDLAGQMREVAAFLDVGINESRFPTMVEHCGFAWMKANGNNAVALGGAFLEGGAQTFINKGTNARWRDTLTPEDSLRYEAEAKARLGEECAAWLAQGALVRSGQSE